MHTESTTLNIKNLKTETSLSFLHRNKKNKILLDILVPNNIKFEKKEIDLAVNEEVSRVTSNLSKPDLKNYFGSAWNEITARRVSKSLHLRLNIVSRELDSSTQNSVKAMQKQESTRLRDQIKQKLLDNSIELARSKRFSNITSEWKNLALLSGCDAEQSIKVVNCVLELQLAQQKTGKIVNINSLVKSVINGMRGDTLNIRAFNCLPHEHTNNGNRIVPKLKFTTHTGTNKEIKVNKVDELKEVIILASIFSKYDIKTNISIMVADIDPYMSAYDHIDNDVNKYILELKSQADKLHTEIDIRPISKYIGASLAKDFFDHEMFKEIDDVFNKYLTSSRYKVLMDMVRINILKTKLPSELKTDSVVEEVTKRLLRIELYFGAFFSNKNTIFIERSNFRNMPDLFLIGARKANQAPPFLFYWNDQIK